MEDPQEHLVYCEQRWIMKNVPRSQWAHRFIHTLDVVQCSWYVQQELRKQTITWEMISTQFTATFHFSADDPDLERILHRMKHLIFVHKPISPAQRPVCAYHNNLAQLNQPVYRWKVDSTETEEDGEPRKLHIRETTGDHAV
jgi:hypothetical protein